MPKTTRWVRVSERYFRPTEVETLLGDAKLAQQKLGWVAESSFKDLIFDMMDYDMKQNGLELPAVAKSVKDRPGDEYC